MNKPTHTHKVTTSDGNVHLVNLDGYYKGLDINMLFHGKTINSIIPIEDLRQGIGCFAPKTILSEESETFDWQVAMRMFADGIAVECIYPDGRKEMLWINTDCQVLFRHGYRYLVKTTPKPDVVEYANNYHDDTGTWNENIDQCNRDASNARIAIIKRTIKSDGTIIYEAIKP